MAVDAARAFGTDLACVDDADELFSEVSGVALVRQDTIHRLLTDDVLGPGGDAWGYNCRRLLGLPTRRLSAQQPLIQEVLLRDDRLQNVDVRVTSTPLASGLRSVDVAVSAKTAFGSFDFVLPISALSADTLAAQVR